MRGHGAIIRAMSVGTGWSMVTVLALEALWLWALYSAIVLIAT
jgi:hypothetical protein